MGVSVQAHDSLLYILSNDDDKSKYHNTGWLKIILALYVYRYTGFFVPEQQDTLCPKVESNFSVLAIWLREKSIPTVHVAAASGQLDDTYLHLESG